MDCLSDYIGLRDCTQTESPSGLFINDFPSMQTELLEKISSPEQTSYAGLWASVQRVAYQRLKTDIQAALFKSAFARLDQVLFQTSKQFVQNWEQIEALPASAEFRGVFVSIQGSKYLGLTIRQLYVFNAGLESVPAVPIKIFQCQDGKLLWSGEIELDTGMNYVPVNKTFSAEE
jgi:hypothetical protein